MYVCVCVGVGVGVGMDWVGLDNQMKRKIENEGKNGDFSVLQRE